MVSDADIAELLEKEREPKSVCEQLVAVANQRGGLDNITALVATFDLPT
jgi:serine/threonine protein phosphatase PrpC